MLQQLKEKWEEFKVFLKDFREHQKKSYCKEDFEKREEKWHSDRSRFAYNRLLNCLNDLYKDNLDYVVFYSANYEDDILNAIKKDVIGRGFKVQEITGSRDFLIIK